MSNLTAIIDADTIKYAASNKGQKTSIVVTHPTLGINEEFKTRTDFYGHYLNKSGGWLADYNKNRDSPILPSEFTIEDVVVPEPLANCLHTVKEMYRKMYEALGTKKHKGFIGKGDCFRVERSTLLKYKDCRPAAKPIYFNEVSDYLERRLKCEVVTIEETDERVVQECYKKPHCVALGSDKDYYGQPIRFLNINRLEEGIINCNTFGKLWLDTKTVIRKGKEVKEESVRGFGRQWLYYQTLSLDDIDNYAANCFSDVRWGPKSAYKLLSPCMDDKEALQSLVGGFKTLYPEPKTVVGWRGQPIDIDWLYVAQEVFTMARMRRVKGEPEVMLTDVFNKLGIQYGDNS
jgi:hypothetical protein